MSPFKPIMVLIAKAVPYLVLSIVNFIIILILSVYLLDIQIKGSLALIFAESILFIITCLSLGLLISNRYEFSADGHAYFYDGYDVTNLDTHWFYVST